MSDTSAYMRNWREWVRLSEIYTKADGDWKPVGKVWQKQGGVWEEIYEQGAMRPVFFNTPGTHHFDVRGDFWVWVVGASGAGGDGRVGSSINSRRRVVGGGGGSGGVVEVRRFSLGAGKSWRVTIATPFLERLGTHLEGDGVDIRAADGVDGADGSLQDGRGRGGAGGGGDGAHYQEVRTGGRWEFNIQYTGSGDLPSRGTTSYVKGSGDSFSGRLSGGEGGGYGRRGINSFRNTDWNISSDREFPVLFRNWGGKDGDDYGESARARAIREAPLPGVFYAYPVQHEKFFEEISDTQLKELLG